jgi:hypothetical protein
VKSDYRRLEDQVVANITAGAKPKKLESKHYRPGQTFSPERFAQICEERGYDPGECAIKFLAREDLDLKDKDRLDAHIKLMEYAYAKRKAVEITGANGGPVEVESVKRPQLTKEEWLIAHGVGTAAGSAE